MTVCCDCPCTGTETAELSVRHLAKLPSDILSEIKIQSLNSICSTTAVESSYCYCVNVAEGDLFSGTA